MMNSFFLGTRWKPARPALGQFIPEPLLEDFAKKLANAAAPHLREIVGEERERLSVSVKEGLPWAGASALALLGTTYLVPGTMPTAKFAGYSASIILMLIGVGVLVSTSKGTAA